MERRGRAAPDVTPDGPDDIRALIRGLNLESDHLIPLPRISNSLDLSEAMTAGGNVA